MYSVWFRRTSVRLLKFLKRKDGRPNFGVETILQKVQIIWTPFLHFNFKSFMYQNFSSFIRIKCILLDSGVRFSDYWNSYKLKRVYLISGENQFCKQSELFGPFFCISILKLSRTQILCHSLDFQVFRMIQRIFLSDFWHFYKLKRGGLISGGNQFCRKSELFGPPFGI